MSVAPLRSPFLAQDSFDAVEHEAPAPRPRASLTPARSPFLAVYEAGGERAVDEPLREAFAALVDELHDDEFDEAMAGVHNAARAFHDRQLAAGRPRESADRLLEQRFEPLLRDTAAMVDAVAEQFAPREAAYLPQGMSPAQRLGHVPPAAAQVPLRRLRVWHVDALAQREKTQSAAIDGATRDAAHLGGRAGSSSSRPAVGRRAWRGTRDPVAATTVRAGPDFEARRIAGAGAGFGPSRPPQRFGSTEHRHRFLSSGDAP